MQAKSPRRVELALTRNMNLEVTEKQPSGLMQSQRYLLAQMERRRGKQSLSHSEGRKPRKAGHQHGLFAVHTARVLRLMAAGVYIYTKHERFESHYSPSRFCAHRID